MSIVLNLESQETFTQDYGDKMSITSFISSCEAGGFIDYDGYAGEILLDNRIVYEGSIYPSDALIQKTHLLSLEKEHEGLQIVWYNR